MDLQVGHWVSSLRRVSLEALRPNGENAAPDSGDTITSLPAWLIWTFMAVAAAKIALVAALPVQALTNARYDDALFMRSASQLSCGNWLGPYDQRTLLKGPMFPMFISLCHIVGLPLKLGEHLLYIFFCFVLIRAIRPLRFRPWLLLVLFTAVLFDPVWMFDAAHRTIREFFYTGLTGLVFACAFGLVLRRHLPLRWTCLWGVGLGLSLTCFWLTREEGLWIVPPLLILLAWAGGTVVRHHPHPWRWFGACGLPFVICFLGVWTVCFLNAACYGVFTVAEVNSRQFLAVTAALCRIEHTEPHDHVVLVPKEVRLRAYNVSPAFRELQPYLEGRPGKVFADYTASEENLQGEIRTGNFWFALMDAMAMAGHAKSGRDAAEYYARLAGEINDACDRGLIAARPRRAFLFPPCDSRAIPFFPAAFATTLKTLMFMDGMLFTVGPSIGSEELLSPFREMTKGTLSATEPPLMKVRGVVFSPPAPLFLYAMSGDNVLNSTLTWSDEESLKLIAWTQGCPIREAGQEQFLLVFPQVEKVDLAILIGGKTQGRIPLDDRPKQVNLPPMQLWIGSVLPNAVDYTELKDARMAISQLIGISYQRATLPITCLALAAFLVQCVAGFVRNRTDLLVLELVLLLAVVARLAAMALADTVGGATAEQFRLLMPAHVLLVVFCVLSIAQATPFAVAWCRKLKSVRQGPANQ